MNPIVKNVLHHVDCSGPQQYNPIDHTDRACHEARCKKSRTYRLLNPEANEDQGVHAEKQSDPTKSWHKEIAYRGGNKSSDRNQAPAEDYRGD